MTNSIINAKLEYYKDPFIFSLLQSQYKVNNLYREIGVINSDKDQKIAIRCMSSSSIDYLKTNLEYTYLHNDANLYAGVCRMKMIPFFKFGEGRKEKTRYFFRNDFKGLVKNKDLFFDFDFDNVMVNFELFINEVFGFVNYLDKNKISFEFVFSGNRGFKILILNDFYDLNEVLIIYTRILDKFKFKYCDTIGYTIPSKFMKCNYSLVYKHHSIKIALPIIKHYTYVYNSLLNDRDFRIFNYNNDYSKDLIANLKEMYLYKDQSVLYRECNLFNPDHDRINLINLVNKEKYLM